MTFSRNSWKWATMFRWFMATASIRSVHLAAIWDLKSSRPDENQRNDPCGITGRSGEWEPYFASIRDYAPNALQILEYAYIEPGVLTEHLQKLESRYGALRF